MGFEEIPGLRDRIATRIRGSQQAENLSESAWARRHGFSQHQVNAWVSARSRTVPSLRNLQKLATLFGMPWQALLIGSEGLDEVCAFMRPQREAVVATGSAGEIVSVRAVSADVYEIRYENGRVYRGPLRRFQDSALVASAARTQKPQPAPRSQRRRRRVERNDQED
jgi:transcriptional regulator with XRE-family HTH domain